MILKIKKSYHKKWKGIYIGPKMFNYIGLKFKKFTINSKIGYLPFIYLFIFKLPIAKFGNIIIIIIII